MCACIIMQVKMKPELALIQSAVFNHWAVTLINCLATSYLFYFGNYLGPNIQTGSSNYQSNIAGFGNSKEINPYNININNKKKFALFK